MNANSLGPLNEVQTLLERENIFVVCAADNNYAMPLAVTMRSVLENLSSNRKITFFIIDGGIADVNKQKILKSIIAEKCEVKFVLISDSLLKDIEEAHKTMGSANQLKIAEYVSIASFYRLLIPELVPKEINKVIYLDCDLVVNANLERLWEIDINGNYVLAAQDTWIRNFSSPTGYLNYQKLELDPNSKYFNAGVLVINLKKWRENGFTVRAINYFKENLEYIGWYDQGILNAMLVDQWGEIDQRWNISPTSTYCYSSWQESPFSEDVYNNVINDPYIIHYVSDKKPWNSRHTPNKEYFFKYVDLTEWEGWRLTIFRRLLLRIKSEFRKILSK